jgi:hypothetical protein
MYLPKTPLCAHRNCLDHIASLTDPRVKQYSKISFAWSTLGDAVVFSSAEKDEMPPSTCRPPAAPISDYAFHDPDERGRTVIRHDDSVHSRVHSRMRVLHRLHALKHDRPLPILAQERKVLPHSKPARGRLPQPPAAYLHRQRGLLVALRKEFPERVHVKRERGAFVRGAQGHPCAA